MTKKAEESKIRKLEAQVRTLRGRIETLESSVLYRARFFRVWTNSGCDYYQGSHLKKRIKGKKTEITIHNGKEILAKGIDFDNLREIDQSEYLQALQFWTDKELKED